MNPQENTSVTSRQSPDVRQSFFQNLKKRAMFKMLLGGSVVLISSLSALVVFDQFTQKSDPAQAQKSEIIVQASPTTATQPYGKEIIGFLPSWMAAKNATVDPSKLTQIIYFGLSVDKNGNLIKFDQDGNMVLEWNYFLSDYMKNVRKEAAKTNTKVLIAIKNFDNEEIDSLVSSKDATNTLSRQLLNLINSYDLDGVNIDFEYVTDSSFPTSKYFNQFLLLLKNSLKGQKPSLILSVDVNAKAVMDDRAFDMVKIGEIVDQVILMAYDYHLPSSRTSGPVSPLNAQPHEHSITQSVQSLTGRLPFEKLILGIPFYGYEWETLSTGFQSLAVPNSGALATYKRVKELIDNRADLVIKWNDNAASSYLTYYQSGAIKQIYYENEQSMNRKVEFLKEKKLGGMAIWALGYEGEHQDLWRPLIQLRQ